MEYRKDLDALKGVAIIAVVLFHLGLLKSGYLGVDVFFVINGFLVVPSVIKKIQDGTFLFLMFLRKKIIRLLPLIVVVSMISLVLGYYLMLPDHYENLSQSVIASNLMSQNILSAITTKNYWDVVNDYKPLMHLWYVGILFEFYILLPMIMMIVKKFAIWMKVDCKKAMVYVLLLLTIISLLFYLNPSVTAGDRFYFLQYRFFELGLGGLAALILESRISGFRIRSQNVQLFFSLILVVVVFCSIYCVITGNNESVRVPIGAKKILSNGLPIASNWALLITVFSTCIVVACRGGSVILKSKILVWLGRMSYSIFIWHQVFLAWYRYSIAEDMNFGVILLYLVIVLGISIISYYFIEKKIPDSRKSVLVWCVAAFLVILPSFYIYIHAGVMRNIPELDVVKGTEHRGMFGEYCDRIYNYKEFPKKENGKFNVLVEGVSFGRDFANIILESEYKDSVNIAYAYTWNENNIEELVKQSDYIFTFTAKDEVPAKVWENLKQSCKVKGISTKNYGACNGIIYRNRNSSDYFDQVALIEDGYVELNKKWKSLWGNDYIDLISPVLVDDKHVRIFTDDKRFISQDCRHLTKAGAQWYARQLDWTQIFK